jgi:hypothetical protein
MSASVQSANSQRRTQACRVYSYFPAGLGHQVYVVGIHRPDQNTCANNAHQHQDSNYFN